MHALGLAWVLVSSVLVVACGEDEAPAPPPQRPAPPPVVVAEAEPETETEADTEADTETETEADTEAVDEAGDPLRACMSSPNYSRCIVDSLEGRARSCRQMEALIEAYRVLGNTAARQRVIGTFVDRCPNDPRARQYRQMLNP